MGDTEIKDGLSYSADHEWVRVEGDIVVIGITDHAQSELTDIVFAELPEIGKIVKKGEIEVTQEHRDAETEKRRKQVIDFLDRLSDD